MNTPSAPGASLPPDSTDLFTTTHLTLVAVLMVLVIVAILFGIRLSRRRKQARAELEEHNARLEQHAAAPSPAPAPQPREVAAPAAVPVARPIEQPIRPAPLAAASSPDGAGPVTQLKGLGPKVATRLGELGITTVGDIAALNDDEAHALDAQLGPFAGRMARDRWQEQARFLAAGDRAGFEAVFGRL